MIRAIQVRQAMQGIQNGVLRVIFVALAVLKVRAFLLFPFCVLRSFFVVVVYRMRMDRPSVFCLVWSGPLCCIALVSV